MIVTDASIISLEFVDLRLQTVDLKSVSGFRFGQYSEIKKPSEIANVRSSI